MTTLDRFLVIAIYIVTMVGFLHIANKLGETENRLNYICGEVQKLDLLAVDKKGVCVTIKE